MKKVKDLIRAALKLKGYFGREDDMLLKWARDHGAQSYDRDGALLEMLQLNGASSNDLDKAWLEIYESLGLSGSQEKMKMDFWQQKAHVFPLSADVGWTGKEFCNNE